MTAPGAWPPARPRSTMPPTRSGTLRAECGWFVSSLQHGWRLTEHWQCPDAKQAAHPGQGRRSHTGLLHCARRVSPGPRAWPVGRLRAIRQISGPTLTRPVSARHDCLSARLSPPPPAASHTGQLLVSTSPAAHSVSVTAPLQRPVPRRPVLTQRRRGLYRERRRGTHRGPPALATRDRPAAPSHVTRRLRSHPCCHSVVGLSPLVGPVTSVRPG